MGAGRCRGIRMLADYVILLLMVLEKCAMIQVFTFPLGLHCCFFDRPLARAAFPHHF